MSNISVERTPEAFTDKIVLRREGSEKTFPLKTVITRGVSAHYEIERCAPEHADLVIMTTHGYSGLAHFFLGSTTEMVVRHVQIPVVTQKPSREVLKNSREVDKH